MPDGETITTYEQDGEKIGKLIGEELIKNIEQRNEYENKNFLVSGRILYGGSVAKIDEK